MQYNNGIIGKYVITPHWVFQGIFTQNVYEFKENVLKLEALSTGKGIWCNDCIRTSLYMLIIEKKNMKEEEEEEKKMLSHSTYYK